MTCNGCGHANRVGANFCSNCGSKLERLCVECGVAVPAKARFCDACGTPVGGLEATAPEPKAERSVSAIPDAQRRQLTVMFCDLVGSTQLSQRLDPEELREIISLYQNAASAEIRTHGGFIARYMGDGIMAYFGYPTAHEDDANSAVRAGLAIIEALSPDRIAGKSPVDLSVRIGIATGLVVVGDIIGEGIAEEKAVLGQTPNLAARLQSAAKPDTVLAAESTLHLLDGTVQFHEPISLALKGFTKPVVAAQITGFSNLETRFAALQARRDLSPLVGRADEIALLERRWQHVQNQDGQVVLISGEPGIGKSRLVDHLLASIDATVPRLRFQCSPHHSNSALYPFIAQLEHALALDNKISAEERVARLEAFLSVSTPDSSKVVAIFAALLSIALPEHYAALDLSPARQKEETLSVLQTKIEKQATPGPLILLFEDAHWVDPTSLELLESIVERLQKLPILLLVTFRPEFSANWVGSPHVTLLSLNRLSERQGIELVQQITDASGLSTEVVAQIVEKTDGVPLFVEELTMLLMERSRAQGEAPGNAGDLAIPSSLQDSLTARLDQLGEVKELVQLGATIGREFGFELLSAVTEFGDTDLLARLNDIADILHRRGAEPHVRYVFKHALLQEAAYASLLKSTRQQYHERIASCLASDAFADIRAKQPELVAHHHTEAGVNEQALDWWLKAGRRALARAANLEAIHHFNRGLLVLENLPAGTERDRKELALQIGLGPALFATQGYAAPDVERVYARAHALGQSIGDAPEMFSVQWGLWAFRVVRADLALALHAGEQMLAIAKRDGNTDLEAEAHLTIGLTLYFLAKPATALTHLERAIAIDVPERDRSFTALSGQDAGVCARTYAGLTLWMLGRPQEALAHSNEAIALARRLDHAFSLAYALNFGAWLQHMLNDHETVFAWADEEVRLSEDLGFFWTTLGNVMRGWARTQRGEHALGLSEIRAGVAGYRTSGARLSETLQLAVDADACLAAEKFDEGLSRIDEALHCAQQSGEIFWVPELHRLRGKLLEKVGGNTTASLKTALDTAQTHGLIMLALRAATNLTALDPSANNIEILRSILQEFAPNTTCCDLTAARRVMEHSQIR